MAIINTQIKGSAAPVIEALNVSPSTSAQQITAPQGTDGYSPVNVSAVTAGIDSNIQAGNIKDGVTILGVTGNYQGGITPSGTINITTNGTHNVTNYATADVQVPTTAPTYYIDKVINANNRLTGGSHLIDFSNISGFEDYALAYAYYHNTSIPATTINLSSLVDLSQKNVFDNAFAYSSVTGVDLSNLESVGGDRAFQNAFDHTALTGRLDLSKLNNLYGQYVFNYAFSTTNITGVDFSSFCKIGGQYAFQYAFSGCTSLTSVSFPAFEGCEQQGSGTFQYTFYNCSGLTSISFPKMYFVTADYFFSNLCSNCTNLTNVDFSALAVIKGSSNVYTPFNSTFQNCTSLTSVSFPKLAMIISTANIFQYTFRSCTNLQNLYFPALEPSLVSDNSNIFAYMLYGCTGVTVHFPSNMQTKMSSWASVANGFSGTNTTVLFDLPATNDGSLDLSYVTEMNLNAATTPLNNSTDITHINLSGLKKFVRPNGAFTNDTALISVDLSSLQEVPSNAWNGMQIMFQNCSALTSVDLSSFVGNNLTKGGMFAFTTSLTTVRLDSCSVGTLREMMSSTSNKDVYLPAIPNGFASNGFYYFCNSSSNITIHLPKNLDPQTGNTTISGQTGYPNFRGSNIVLMYDLPSTLVLTGSDTNTYSRNPKYDTQTALAWKLGQHSSLDLTPYYTSGTADPVVGDTIYSDSTCTTAVTTIDSIA